MKNSQPNTKIVVSLPFSLSSVYPHLPKDKRMAPMEGRGKYDVYPGDLVGKLHKEKPFYGRVVGKTHNEMFWVQWADDNISLEEKRELVNTTLHADAFVNESNLKKVLGSILNLWKIDFSLCLVGPITTVTPGDFVAKVRGKRFLYGRVVAGNSKSMSFSVVWEDGTRERARSHDLIMSTEQANSVAHRYSTAQSTDGLVWLTGLKVQWWSRRTVRRVATRKKNNRKKRRK